MKTLGLTFDDKDFEKLKEKKDKSSMKWEDFILDLSGVKKCK